MNKNPEPDGDLEEELRNAIENHESRQNADYDGVLGMLPEWVPEPVTTDFEHARNRILNWGFEPERITGWIDYYIDSMELAKTDIDSPELNDIPQYPVVAPNGSNVNLAKFDDILTILTSIKMAISLGPDEGLKILGGSLAHSEYKRRIRMKGKKPKAIHNLFRENFNQLIKRLGRCPSPKEVMEALEDFRYDDDRYPIFRSYHRDDEDGHTEIRWYKDPRSETEGTPIKYETFRNIISKLTQEHKKSKI